MSDIMVPQPRAVFGDLTIVHNINFNGQNNPMQNMMAMQQQNMMAMQQQNMMLAAANMQRLAIQQMSSAVAQREIALENKIEQLKQLGLCEPSERRENLKIAASATPDGILSNDKNVEDVECTVQDSTIVESEKEKEVIKDAKVVQINKRRLLDFFDEDGDFKNDKYSYDKLYKIPEDVRTLVCFTTVSKDNPLEWRNKFRKAYLSVKKQAFKGVDSIRLTDETKFIVIVELKNQYHIIYIKNTNPDDFELNKINEKDKELFGEFVMGIKARFDSWNIVVEPMIDNDYNKNYSKSNLLSVQKDCLFSNGTYTIDPSDICNYNVSF